MNNEELNDVVETLQQRVDRIEDFLRVKFTGTLDEAIETKVRARVVATAVSGEQSGTFGEFYRQPIRFGPTEFFARDNEEWGITFSVVANESRHSKWLIIHFMEIRNKDGSQHHASWPTWSGTFGPGYSEKNGKVGGKHSKIVEYWEQLLSGEATWWSSFLAFRQRDDL